MALNFLLIASLLSPLAFWFAAPRRAEAPIRVRKQRKRVDQNH